LLGAYRCPLASIQVWEARVFSNVFLVYDCFQFSFTFIMFVCICGCLENIVMLFGFECLVVARVNSGKNWYFCPSEHARLGENRRSSPWFFFKLSLRWQASVLSDELSRSGEEVSLNRELAKTCSAPCL